MRKRSSYYRYAVLILLSLSLIVSCNKNNNNGSSNYVQTVRAGYQVLPWPRQMESLFGDGSHMISYYGRATARQTWQTEVFFYGRYTLTLEAEVQIDYNHHTLKPSTGQPKFYLHEIKTIENDKGRAHTTFSGQWIFDEDKWRKLVSAGGDWSVIGIPVKTNNPIPLFDFYEKSWRSHGERIPH